VSAEIVDVVLIGARQPRSFEAHASYFNCSGVETLTNLGFTGPLIVDDDGKTRALFGDPKVSLPLKTTRTESPQTESLVSGKRKFQRPETKSRNRR
jgi:hypothetical protein